MKTINERDADMIESIEMWLHEIEPKWVEKELAWLDELRTRLAEEPVSDCHDLEEEISTWIPAQIIGGDNEIWRDTKNVITEWAGIVARHFAKWQYQKDRGEFAKIKARTWCEGFDACKTKMMEGAVEGVVMDFSSNQPRPQVDVLLDPHKYHTGDKVKIIIVKED